MCKLNDMTRSYYSIAIDGPGGAGKSTVARKLAEELNTLYLDTGAMYRACGLKASRLGLTKDQIEKIENMLEHTDIAVQFIENEQHVFLDGEDVTTLIRTPDVSIWASDISAIFSCRIKMVELQRQIAKQNNVVMDGRDTGSYVLPDATLKIFLTATLKERATRRWKELQLKGDKTSYDTVLSDLQYRDEQDSNREFAPLVCLPEAKRIDSTNMDIDQVVQIILNWFYSIHS